MTSRTKAVSIIDVGSRFPVGTLQTANPWRQENLQHPPAMPSVSA